MFSVDLFLFSTFEHDALNGLLGKTVVAMKVLHQKVQLISEELLLGLRAVNADAVSSGRDLQFWEIGSDAVEVAIVRSIEIPRFEMFQENFPCFCPAVFLCLGQVWMDA